MQDSLISTLKPLVIKTCGGYEYFDYKEVIRFQAEGNNTLVYIINRDSPLRVLYNLSDIEQKHVHPVFFRCHRSHIVNLQHLVKFNDKSRQLVLAGEHIVPVSENYKGKLIDKTVKGL
ncbi:MAG: LytTR family DNA-binding domain-containing protein [Bacteroidota bacterium]|nr:LytTR family DNA-binding domain-containing protein [Bacteroidota bacterium]